MIMENDRKTISRLPIWFIERTGFGIPEDAGLYPEINAESVIEYVVSDFAKYMLDPNPMEISKRLVGCEIHRRKSRQAALQSRLMKWTPWYREPPEEPPETLLADPPIESPSTGDRQFADHMNRINETLRPYDRFARKMSKLDPDTVAAIVGICEDLDGNRSILNLEGDTQSKINYMINNYARDVNVILEHRQLAPGLFEMRGFDFSAYNPENRHRLIRFYSSGESRACVMGPDRQIQYWIQDLNGLKYMHLLDQAIQENPKLQDAFARCIAGEFMPLKILFNTKFEMGYSDAHLPALYRELFASCDLKIDEKDVLVSSLNHLQLGVAFSYMVPEANGKPKLYTHISVLHNVKALEPIRRRMPKLYSEINKRIGTSETRRFYLLDAIGGYVYA